MDSSSFGFVALLMAACHAAAQPQTTCSEWQSKFFQVQASWRDDATRRSDLERSFGAPTRVETNGPCSLLHYTSTGCSAVFTVCSTETIVSKTLTMGAAAVPAFVTSDPAALGAAIQSLQEALAQSQARMAKMQEAIDALSPPPTPASAFPTPPPAARKPVAARVPAAPKKCAAVTRKGEQCSRNAAEGSSYCWQHKK